MNVIKTFNKINQKINELLEFFLKISSNIEQKQNEFDLNIKTSFVIYLFKEITLYLKNFFLLKTRYGRI